MGHLSQKLGPLFHYHMLPQVSFVIGHNMALITFLFDTTMEGINNVVLELSPG